MSIYRCNRCVINLQTILLFHMFSRACALASQHGDKAFGGGVLHATHSDVRVLPVMIVNLLATNRTVLQLFIVSPQPTTQTKCDLVLLLVVQCSRVSVL